MSSKKPTALQGVYKRGSSWSIGYQRKDEAGTAIDMTGLTTRAMFRVGGVSEPVVLTLSLPTEIVITDPASGFMVLKFTRSQSALFNAGDKVYFDIEQTNPLDPDYEWQSPTFFFTVIEQVTRDD
jgi:hypothetical protein